MIVETLAYFRNLPGAIERTRLVILVLIAFSLPFDMFYSSLLLITLTALTLLDLSRERLGQIPVQVWIFQAVYLLSLAGYFYSADKKAAGYLLERQLTIFLFPLVLPLVLQFKRQTMLVLLNALSIGSIMALFYLFIALFVKVLITLELPPQYLVSGVFLNHEFSKPLAIHAGYLSLYVCLSIIHILYRFINTPRLSALILHVLALMVLAAGLIFLASRNSVIALVVILVAVLPFYITGNRARYLILLCGLLALIMIAFFSVDYLRERFSVFLLGDIGPQTLSDSFQGVVLEPRYERWRCATDLLKRSFLFGFGTGDEVLMLKYCYIQSGLYISYLEEFNAHNTYLSILLKHGLLGFLVFLFAFVYYVFLAINTKDFLYLAFLILLLIGFYTENLLDANKGIVLFALFNTAFGYIAIDERRKSSLTLNSGK